MGPVEVAVGEAVPLTHVDQCVSPVEMVHPLPEGDAAIAGGLRDLHVDAADGVDQGLEAREVDDREVVDAHAGEASRPSASAGSGRRRRRRH